MKTSVNFAIKTTKGKRDINQDSLVCTYNHDSDFLGIVCDGIGSVPGSEVASQIVTKTFAIEFEKTYNLEKPIIWAKQTLEKAIKRIDYTSKYSNKPGISTTLALLLIVKNKYYVFNVGDTRIYGFTKDKKIKQLTYDHNYYNYLVKQGTSQEGIMAQKDKWHCLTKYIDATNPVKAEMTYCYGDTSEFRHFLICTDGLYGYCPEEKLIKKVTMHLPLFLRTFSLNHYAYNHDSNDNISNIVVSCWTHGK